MPEYQPSIQERRQQIIDEMMAAGAVGGGGGERMTTMSEPGKPGFSSAADAPVAGYDTPLKKAMARRKKKKLKEEIQLDEKRDGKSAKDKDYSLHDWFKGGGWKQAGGKYDGKPCAKQPGQTTKPYCRDADDRASMSKDERNKRAAKKRKEDPNPDRSGKAKMVTQEGKTFSDFMEEKDACYHKVKASAKVWPSAYASGRLVQCRKKGAANYGKSKKKD